MTRIVATTSRSRPSPGGVKFQQVLTMSIPHGFPIADGSPRGNKGTSFASPFGLGGRRRAGGPGHEPHCLPRSPCACVAGASGKGILTAHCLSDPPGTLKVLEKTAPSPPAGRLPTARSRTVAPEVELPPRNRRAERSSSGGVHDIDARLGRGQRPHSCFGIDRHDRPGCRSCLGCP